MELLPFNNGQTIAILFACLLLLCGSVGVHAATAYVNINNSTPSAPYVTWATAATNIQDAVDAAAAGDLVLVTNGVYQPRKQSNNVVAVTKPLTLLSINGPNETTILGRQGTSAVSCVYLTNGAVLSGFTLTNGGVAGGILGNGAGGLFCNSTNAIASNCVIVGNMRGGVYSGTLYNCVLGGNSTDSVIGGGGASSSVLNNCILATNFTTSSYSPGGGAYKSTLNNCTLIGNSSADSGGGAAISTLNNCILSNNTAFYGGGVFNSTLINCSLTGNSANGGGGSSAGALTNCILDGNSARFGGGANGGVLDNCQVQNNRAGKGGGIFSGNLYHCTIIGNLATNGGGGSYDALMNNCTVSGNTATNGGGVSDGTLNNCIVSSNTAAVYGGGVYNDSVFTDYSDLTNCLVIGNSAYSGGGTYYANLNNCTVVGNSASYSGGGSMGGTLNNCILYYNGAVTNANYYASLNYCCTTPMQWRTGNITNAPSFVDPAGGDFHLQAGSPCINAGRNVYAQGSTDLDGNVRIRGGTVDVGAYEFQSPTSILSYAWLQQYGLATDGSADFADKDADGLNNWQEWRAATDPTNAASVLKVTQTSSAAGQVTLTWSSVADRDYFVERATDLGAATPFSLLQDNVRGWSYVTSFTDTNAPAKAYYRVGVK